MAKQFTPKEAKKFPPYAMLGTDGAKVRLYNPERGQWGWRTHFLEYHRDAGWWSVDIVEKNGKLYSESKHENLNGLEILPITYIEWKKSNHGYISKTTKANRK
jgi:hypothetical protein